MEISVIIPAKNAEKYLRPCLDSVFNQTFDKEYEVIVGVNESTDNTMAILDEYKQKHKNLIVEDRQNKGPAINRLDSIKVAKGKYICFLDADDYYHPDFLKVMYEEIEKGYDFVNCSFYKDINGRIKKIHLIKNKKLDSIKTCKALLQDYFFRSFFWNKIFKKELFELEDMPRNLDKIHIFEDCLLVYFIAMHVNIVKSIRKRLYYYRNNKESLTKKPNKNRFVTHLKVFAFIKDVSYKNPQKQYFKNFRRKWHVSSLALFFDLITTRKALDEGIFKENKKYKAYKKDIKSKKALHNEELIEFVKSIQ